MSHINISDPDSAHSRWREMLETDKLMAEIAVLKKERDHYRDNLESIFRRVKEGAEVYLQYADGDRIWIVAKPEEVADAR